MGEGWRQYVKYGLGGMAGLIVIGVATLYAVTTPRLERVYVVPARPLIIPRGDAAIARGRHLARIYLCHECHGADPRRSHVRGDSAHRVAPGGQPD